MDHVTFLKTIPPARKAALTERSDTAGLRHLALHLGALGLCGMGIVLGVPGWPLLVLFHGVLLCFLFTLAHECTHQTPFQTRWINEVAGHVSSAAVGMSFTWFRYFHLAHHKHTNDPEHDPELADGPRPQSWQAYLIYLSGWGYWSGTALVLWRLARGAPLPGYLPARQIPRMRREARMILALYALALASLTVSPAVFWLWVLPALVGQPVLRLYLLAEHGRCPPVADMLENSRTTFTNRLVRAVAWNMPYHAEHHAFPNVPFHHLPDLHADLAAHLKSTSNGYTEFTRDYLGDLTAR
ncbi:fatty acid desaturase [Aestuariivita sp.]|jgi:fatty acid desaturase|uniref:fatty acid desaturase n=1 Tax=Aestuariivita sp. TaxID=1872407 RepID=UPI00216EABF1|nr:fatty acid desaturase [Aestuariivita sp.]MCE8009288.1 fatty acid desaturase [Aestuariivita sp.]